MIDFAKRKFPATDYPNLSFQCQDATKLNFYNEFDAIASFYCLHWITDHMPVLEGIKNSLKPSGRTIMKFCGKIALDPLTNEAN
jgi:SAM-dependent methyltransferase